MFNSPINPSITWTRCTLSPNYKLEDLPSFSYSRPLFIFCRSSRWILLQEHIDESISNFILWENNLFSFHGDPLNCLVALVCLLFICSEIFGPKNMNMQYFQQILFPRFILLFLHEWDLISM